MLHIQKMENYSCSSGSKQWLKAPLRISVRLAGTACTVFVSAGSEMCPDFFAVYYWKRRYRIGGNTFLKALYSVPLSPLWNWTVCFWWDFKWQLSARSCFLFPIIKWKNYSVLSFSLFQKSWNDTFSHFITTYFQHSVYLIFLPQWITYLYKTRYSVVAVLSAFSHVCSSFVLKRLCQREVITSVHRSGSVNVKVGRFVSFYVAQRGSQRCPCDENVGLGLAGKISRVIKWEFFGTLLVALSVNKHFPHYLKTQTDIWLIIGYLYHETQKA